MDAIDIVATAATPAGGAAYARQWLGRSAAYERLLWVALAATAIAATTTLSRPSTGQRELCQRAPGSVGCVALQASSTIREAEPREIGI